MKKILIIAGVVILGIILVRGCGKKDKIDAKKDEAVPVRVMRVGMESVNRALEYVGDIKGQDEAVVYPKVSGKIIEKVKEEGEGIVKGETIAYVDRDEVGLKFEKAPIESPLAGVVGRIYVDIGSSVNTQTPVALIADMENAEIDLDIPEKYLPSISEGQEAEVSVDAYPDVRFIGRVTMISPVVDLATRTAPIEITIANPDRHLKSGMFAKVRLIIETGKRAPAILKEAIIGKAPNTYVYVIEDDTAVLRKITLGIREGPYYEVKEGLKEGDRVVIMGQQRLKDGAKVIAEE